MKQKISHNCLKELLYHNIENTGRVGTRQQAELSVLQTEPEKSANQMLFLFTQIEEPLFFWSILDD